MSRMQILLFLNYEMEIATNLKAWILGLQIVDL